MDQEPIIFSIYHTTTSMSSANFTGNALGFLLGHIAQRHEPNLLALVETDLLSARSLLRSQTRARQVLMR